MMECLTDEIYGKGLEVICEVGEGVVVVVGKNRALKEGCK